MADDTDYVVNRLGEAVVRYWTVLPPPIRAQLLDHIAPHGFIASLEVENFIRNSQAGIEWKRNDGREADY